MKPVTLALIAFVALLEPVYAQNQPPADTPPPPTDLPDARALAPRERGPIDELSELVRHVAARSGIEFVIDPRVRANYRYVGDTPVESLTYRELLSILRVHGYIAVEAPEHVLILPDAIARQVASPIVPDDDADIPDEAIVSRIVTLEMEAAQLVPILRPMMPQYAHLAASGNKLVIVDSYDNVRRMTAIVRALDEAPARRR